MFISYLLLQNLFFLHFFLSFSLQHQKSAPSFVLFFAFFFPSSSFSSLPLFNQGREKRMADDWDLQAVVRGCTTTTSTSNTTTTAGSGGATSTSTSACGGDVYRSFGSFEPKLEGGSCLSFQDLLFEPRNIETTAAASSSSCGGIQELHDLYKPFFPKSSPPLSPQSIPISPLSVLGGLQDLSKQQKLQQKHHQQIYQLPKRQTLSIGSSRTSAASHNPSLRSKRR